MSSSQISHSSSSNEQTNWFSNRMEQKNLFQTQTKPSPNENSQTIIKQHILNQDGLSIRRSSPKYSALNFSNVGSENKKSPSSLLFQKVIDESLKEKAGKMFNPNLTTQLNQSFNINDDVVVEKKNDSPKKINPVTKLSPSKDDSKETNDNFVQTELGLVNMNEKNLIEMISKSPIKMNYENIFHHGMSLFHAYHQFFCENIEIVDEAFAYFQLLINLQDQMWQYIDKIFKNYHLKDPLSVHVYSQLFTRCMGIASNLIPVVEAIYTLKINFLSTANGSNSIYSTFVHFLYNVGKLASAIVAYVQHIIHEAYSNLMKHGYTSKQKLKDGRSFWICPDLSINIFSEIPDGMSPFLRTVSNNIKST